MKKGITVMSGILVLGLFGAGAIGIANARPADHSGPGVEHHYGQRHSGMMRGLWRQLDLDETQRSRIREIFREHAPQAREKAHELRAVKKELGGFALSDGFDTERAEALAQRQASLAAELQLMRMTGMNEAWQVLNPAQKAKLDELMTKREARASRHGQGGDTHRRHEGRLHH